MVFRICTAPAHTTGLPPKVETVVAGNEYGFCFFTEQYRADGKAAAQTLCTGYQVRLDAELLIAEQGACSAHACLYFVHNEQDVFFLAGFGYGLNIFFVQRNHAAFALYRFQHDRANIVSHFGKNVGKVVCFGKYEAVHEGEEEIVVSVLSCGGKGCHGSAMERVLQGNDFVSACAEFQKAVFSCGFDNAFIGFRAAVAEKYFFHTAFFTEEFRCLNAGLCVIQVGSVLQRLKLCAYRLYPAVVAKAQSVYADAAGEVDICFACVVLYGGAFAGAGVTVGMDPFNLSNT